MKPKTWLGFFLSGALLISFAATAFASTVIALSLEELVKRAAFVGKTTVVSKEARWEKGRIVTDCLLRIEEPVKGAEPQGKLIRMVLLGGEQGEIGMKVVGEPACGEPGQTNIVAAHKDKLGDYRPVGMSQGWFRIKLDAQGKELVMPSGAGLELVKRSQKKGRLQLVSAAITQPETVESFLKRLKELAQK